MLKLCCCFPQP